MVPQYLLSVFQPVRRVDFFFFFSSRRRHTRLQGDWSSDVCSSDLKGSTGRTGRTGNKEGCVVHGVLRGSAVAGEGTGGNVAVHEVLGDQQHLVGVLAVAVLGAVHAGAAHGRSEEHTSELQSPCNLV